jgi:hypothetical protein
MMDELLCDATGVVLTKISAFASPGNVTRACPLFHRRCLVWRWPMTR